MKQAPATAKWRRVMLRILATLAGPRAALRFAAQPSELAALEYRQQTRKQTQQTEVIFLIPLVKRGHVTDWSAVVTRLQNTLESFHQQTDPRWRAVICSQDRPDRVAWNDQIRFLPFSQQVTGNDKWPKVQHMVNRLPDLCAGSAYVMPFDADDLMHPGAVKDMLIRQASHGYLYSEGYVRDVTADRTGRSGNRSLADPLRKPFWKLCGSCAAFTYDGREKNRTFLHQLVAHEHRMYPYLAKLAARPLTEITTPMAMYMINHGENFEQRRGRIGFKPRFVQRFEITDAEEIKQVRRDFPAGFED